MEPWDVVSFVSSLESGRGHEPRGCRGRGKLSSCGEAAWCSGTKPEWRPEDRGRPGTCGEGGRGEAREPQRVVAAAGEGGLGAERDTEAAHPGLPSSGPRPAGPAASFSTARELNTFSF